MTTISIPGLEGNTFTINGSILSWSKHELPFTVASFPQPYSVSLVETLFHYQEIVASADFVIIDENIARLYGTANRSSESTFTVVPTEDNKSLATASLIIDRMIDLGISKGSNVVAVGGGIVQDLSACACALFRRGQPFIYMPTTTLGQLDSCVGAKCAVNTTKAKNILGLFSAPRSVVIPIFMVRTMPLLDHRAGLAEMLRLCLTASMAAVQIYNKLLDSVADLGEIDLTAYSNAVAISLSIKKSVVEFDEYERDVRRSMNYGHTFGHAIEKLANFQIPHGLGVLLGMHIANVYATAIGIMTPECLAELTGVFTKSTRGISLPFLASTKLNSEQIISQFRYDKKGDGTSVPLILIEEPGSMIFHKYQFDQSHEVLAKAIDTGIASFSSWINRE
jgi:3-dehydroquinate synthase